MLTRWIAMLPFPCRTPCEYDDLREAVHRLVRYPDSILREFALRRVAAFVEELQQLAGGQIEFRDTETWRATYEQILQGLTSSLYRSVSWVKSHQYWQDLPGRQSMQLNYQMLDRGLRIERIFILSDHLWPLGEVLPEPRIRRWLEEQHYRGIAVSLARESDLWQEENLLRDFGIYGERATGEQEIDDESRTVRFTVRFDRPAIQRAGDRWERLQLFTTPYGELLDRTVAA